MADANDYLGVHEGFADIRFIREHSIVEGISESYYSVVIDLVFLVNTDDMLGPSLQEDSTNELRMA
jgi:hypothetical protein